MRSAPRTGLPERRGTDVERSEAPPLLQIVVVLMSQPSQQTFRVFCTAGERSLSKERPDYSDVPRGVKPS